MAEPHAGAVADLRSGAASHARPDPGGRGTRPGFRPDIQGLRAIAIVTVILGHARLGPFSGGYVGVDVFFAISGFLITQLLLREVARTGTLSIPGFYARRARRILPAATLVLAATAVASGLWLGTVEGPVVMRDVLWAAFFAANVRFARQGTDYFAHDLPPSPVQHFWSLAVEEQFYLVWPLLMLGVVALARHLGARRRAHPSVVVAPVPRPPLAALALAVGVLSLTSFLWSLSATSHHPQSAYFSIFTRAWELGVGALGAVAVEALVRNGRRLAPPQLVCASVVGLGLICWPVVTYDANTPFPGWHAALPVGGSALLLVVGGIAARPSIVQRALSIPPMRTVGDWSYSLYLWHWPLLVIPAMYLGHALTLVERLGMVALALVLSAVTYRYVETPFRSARPFHRVRVAAGLYPATVALVAVACLGGEAAMALMSDHTYHPPISLRHGWQERFHTHDRSVALVRASIVAARQGRPIPTNLHPALGDLRNSLADVGRCDYSDDSMRDLCPRGDPSSERTIVVLGNSHARHWIPAFDRIGEGRGYRLYYLTRSQCVMSDVVPDQRSSTAPDTSCVQFRDWAVSQIADLHPDLVVVSTSPTSNGPGLFDAQGRHVTDSQQVDQAIQEGYVGLLERLKPLADRTVFLLDIPFSQRDPGTCLGAGRPTLATCLGPYTHEHRLDAIRQEEAAGVAGVEAVPTVQWFCHRDRCPAVVGDMVVHRDGGHMTNEYSASLARSLARRLGLTASPPDG